MLLKKNINGWISYIQFMLRSAMLTGIIIFSIVTLVTVYILIGARQS
ncbi:MAG: hypothetical protein MUC75_01675 [Ignavibacteriaceae bacterium]|nr:hypothetical protein [Ignavibacteriaceae bacterium]